jgi:hypothetical protein
MHPASANVKSLPSLLPVMAGTKKLWRQYRLTDDQTYCVAKAVRRVLAIERPKTRKRVVARLSREEERKLNTHASRIDDQRELSAGVGRVSGCASEDRCDV